MSLPPYYEFTILLPEFKLHGFSQSRSTEEIVYRMAPLELKECDRQELQRDPTFIPAPRIEDRMAHTFSLNIKFRIL